MKAILFFVSFLLPFAFSQISSTYQCYQCASMELKQRWHLTMLPTSLGDGAFRNSCNSTDGLGKAVPCNGPCLTYIIEDPDYVGKKLYVRGCKNDLTQIQSSVNNMNGMGSPRFCEYDESFKRPNSLGQMVPTKILAERCMNATIACNDRDSFPGEGSGINDCTDSKYNNTINNEVLSCYDCETTNGNCKKGKCSKKYCVKSVSKVQGTYSTRKYCTDVNPFGQNEMCSAYDLTVTLLNINTIGGHSNICYCKNKQYCNSASKFPIGLNTLILIFVAKVLSD